MSSGVPTWTTRPPSMMAMRSYRWFPVLVAAAAALLVASLGATFTDLGPWYQSLRQPAWKPPDVLFGPAWTLIFGLVAFSAFKTWDSTPDLASRTWIVGLFCLNGVLNILWSWLFFRLQRPDLALAEVVLLLISIVALIVFVRPHSRTASWLLVPYLAWVTFAAFLNLAVVRLNYDFI